MKKGRGMGDCREKEIYNIKEAPEVGIIRKQNDRLYPGAEMGGFAVEPRRAIAYPGECIYTGIAGKRVQIARAHQAK